MGRIPIRLASTKPSQINIKVKHDYDENMDEIMAGNEKFYGKDRKWHDTLTTGREWRKEKKEFDKLSYAKQHKDFMYSESARVMYGFHYEHAASWTINDYGPNL